MNERAKIAGGRLLISGSPEKGTTISVIIPTNGSA
jgi:signal transduction histidine kinase